MSITKTKILELALNSSDPFIRDAVDKIIFALKMKYTDEDLLNIYDNYAYHHAVNITMPCTHDAEKIHEVSVAWRRENFRIISMEHQIVTGSTGDLVNKEKQAHVYLAQDQLYKYK